MTTECRSSLAPTTAAATRSTANLSSTTRRAVRRGVEGPFCLLSQSPGPRCFSTRYEFLGQVARGAHMRRQICCTEAKTKVLRLRAIQLRCAQDDTGK